MLLWCSQCQHTHYAFFKDHTYPCRPQWDIWLQSVFYTCHGLGPIKVPSPPSLSSACPSLVFQWGSTSGQFLGFFRWAHSGLCLAIAPSLFRGTLVLRTTIRRDRPYLLQILLLKFDHVYTLVDLRLHFLTPSTVIHVETGYRNTIGHEKVARYR